MVEIQPDEPADTCAGGPVPPSTAPAKKNTALIVAHPGHELRVHGWLEAARPTVFVLTDGSGASGRSRLDSTRRVLAAASAEPGALFGRLTDAVLYDAVTEANHPLFIQLAEELAEAISERDIDVVAGDASEGYNPGHDVCRLLIDTAVALAGRGRSQAIANLDFSLYHRPDAPAQGDGLRLELDPDAFARKLDAAQAYPELAAEVDATFQKFGADAFRIECLCAAAGGESPSDVSGQLPYERHGEKRVAAGKYHRVLRYREHMLPLAQALSRHVGGGDA